MIHTFYQSDTIQNQIYIPRYYDPNLKTDIASLRETHNCHVVEDLIQEGTIAYNTGNEIGKLSYGTGDIPFVRTSDLSNWEIKSLPKQGVSESIYEKYAPGQDVQEGDILLVKDGTYLIGTNCFITVFDTKIIFQSHILKFRIIDKDKIDPHLFFLAINSSIVQRQIRSIQFTADIIDTIGERFKEITIPLPKDKRFSGHLIKKTKTSLETRNKYRALVKQFSLLIEQTLLKNSIEPFSSFLRLPISEINGSLNHSTVTAEFGKFEAFWKNSNDIKESIYLPKYYDPLIKEELGNLADTCDLCTMGDLQKDKIIEYHTGDEIGKMAYGTGDIPFIRTSDFSNWELKHNPKQGVSEEIYKIYSEKEDVQENDIFLVRDGTYLVGSSCFITEYDKKCLYCGGLYKIRSHDYDQLDPWLLLALLNSYIVKRQIRTKQFTRDVIDTIGNRIDEVILPIPKNPEIRKTISDIVKKIITLRITERFNINLYSKMIIGET